MVLSCCCFDRPHCRFLDVGHCQRFEPFPLCDLRVVPSCVLQNILINVIDELRCTVDWSEGLKLVLTLFSPSVFSSPAIVVKFKG
jgi:hypothetical protein